MINPYEAVPETRPDRQFPVSDVDIKDSDRGWLVITELQDENPRTQLENLRALRRQPFQDWKDGPGQKAVWDSMLEAEKLVRDNYDEDSASLTMIGLMTTIGFIRRAELLTLSFHNFSEEIIRIGGYDEGQRQSFADEAWKGMYKNHPNLHGVSAAFSNLLEDTYELTYRKDIALLDSGIVLPYMLTVATRIRDNLHYGLDRTVTAQ